MPNDFDPNREHELALELYKVIDRMLAPFCSKSLRPQFGLGGLSPPIDTSKPSEHGSKAEFQQEYEAICKSLTAVGALLKAQIGDRSNELQRVVLERMRSILDAELLECAPSAPDKNTTNFLRRNVAETGGTVITLFLIIDLQSALRARKFELEQQRDKFWNVPHRAPDYYARAIASRLAKLYVRETGQRPTSGSSPESGGASTGFTKALEEIFELLEIKCKARSPADWAIKHLTDDDFASKEHPLANLGLTNAEAPFTLGSNLGTDAPSEED
jgi:hypothetical protein